MYIASDKTLVERTRNAYWINHRGVPGGQMIDPFTGTLIPACPGNGIDQAGRLTVIVDRQSAGRTPAGA